MLEVESEESRSPLGILPWAGMVLLLSVIVAYSNLWNGTWLFDDIPGIVENSEIASLWPQETLVGPRRPVGHLSFALNHALGGLDPGGYHTVNLAIHALAGLLLFGLLRRLFSLQKQSSAIREQADFLAFAVALLWLVHPLQTQAVTYVVQRLESLAALFTLGCLYAFVRRASGGGVAWSALAILSFALGVGTKETGAMAPVLVVLLDRAFFSESFRIVVRRRWRLLLGFLPGILWLALAVAPAFRVHENPSAGFTLPTVSPLEYTRSQPGVILHYLQLVAWPDRLCLDPLRPIAKTAQEIWLPAGILLGAIAAMGLAWRRAPALAAPGIAFLVLLAPSSSVMPIADLSAEHRMYLPLAPVLVLAVLAVTLAGSRWLPKSWPRRSLALGLLIVVAFVFVGRTWIRNHDYRSGLAMWGDVVRQAPHNPRAQYNLGRFLVMERRKRAAVPHLEAAIRLAPTYADAHNALGVAVSRFDPARAEHSFRTASRLDPEHSESLANLGHVILRRGERAGAEAAYRRALEVDPGLASVHLSLGMLLLEREEWVGATEHLERNVELAGATAKGLNALGEVWLRRGDAARARQFFSEALSLRPDFEPARINLQRLGSGG